MRELWRFPLGLAAGLAGMVALWIGLNLARLHQPIDNETAYWCQYLDYKLAAAAQAPSPKILLVGASNVIYGLRASLLQAELGVPAVNLGLTASLGPDIIVDAAEQAAKPGDLIVLSLEHFFFEERWRDGVSASRSMFACRTDALLGLPVTEQLRQIEAQPVRETVEGIARRYLPAWGLKAPYPPIKLASIGDNGSSNPSADVYDNTREARTPEMVEQLKAHPAGPVFEFSDHSVGARAVRHLVAWARTHQVKIVMSWPSVYQTDPDAVRPGYAQLATFYEQLGVPMLGSYTDGMTPLDTFFNTNNHLIAEAATDRTRRVASQLRPFKPAPASARLHRTEE